jgi:S-ribosylhomocysteine lyase
MAEQAMKERERSRPSSIDPVDERLRATLGEVDHRRVLAPYVRLIACIEGSRGDKVFHWDLRFTQPNREHIEMAAVHSLEHMIATYIQRHLPGFVNFGPMGCQTGFYLTVLNYGDYDGLLDALAETLVDCLEADEVPLANEVQCGWAANHTLEGAQEIARRVLGHRQGWTEIVGEP